jgi:peptidoglycan/LPS O-acetylase OafA/YrhL
MTFSVLFLSYLFIYKNEHNQIGRDSLSALFSSANIYLWTLTRNYWGPQPESSMFLHTWSLSLEEQFYLIFPLVIILFLRKYPKQLPKVLLIFTSLGYLLYALLSTDHPRASFYLLPCRYWEIGIGSSIALYHNHFNSIRKVIPALYCKAISWVGLLLILLGYLWLDESRSLGWGLILPTSGTAIFIVFANKNSFSNLILSSKPFVFTGKISYSLYLWHWPIIQFTKHFNSPFIVSFIALCIVAFLSYKFIETPLRKNRHSLSIIAVSFLSCTCFSIYLSFNKSFYDTSIFEVTTWKGFRYDIAPTQAEWNEKMKSRMHGIKIIERPKSDNQALKTGGIITNKNPESQYPRLIVMGDSHALMWSSVIDEIGHELNATTIFMGMDATFPFIRDFSTKQTNEESVELLYDLRRVESIISGNCVVILCAKWSWNWRHQQSAKEMIDFIENEGSHTIIIEQPPELFFGDKNSAQYLSFLNLEPINTTHHFIKAGNTSDYKKGLDAINKLTRSSKNCSVIRTKDIFLNKKGLVRVLDGKKILYIDDDHLSDAGARLLKHRIKSSLKSFSLDQ